MSSSCRSLFEERLEKSNCSLFPRSRYDDIMAVLKRQGGGDDTPRSLRNSGSRYAIIEKNGKEWLIGKRRQATGESRPIVPSEDLFGVIFDTYKTMPQCSANKLFEELHKSYVNISKEICTIFISCQITENISQFKREGAVFLLDMSSEQFKKLKWAMLYVDSPTQRCYPRAFATKAAGAVADELLKIFIMDGAPEHIHSNLGVHYTRELIRHLRLLDETISITTRLGRFLAVHAGGQSINQVQ